MLQAQPPLDPPCSCCLFPGPVSIFADSLMHRYTPQRQLTNVTRQQLAAPFHAALAPAMHERQCMCPHSARVHVPSMQPPTKSLCASASTGLKASMNACMSFCALGSSVPATFSMKDCLLGTKLNAT